MPQLTDKVRWIALLVIGITCFAGSGRILAQSTPSTSGTPEGQVGTLTITRLSCVGDPAQTRIEVAASGTSESVASATPDKCDPSGGDFILLWNSGRQAQVITVPSTGTGTFTGILATGEDGNPPRLVDSRSSATVYVAIESNAAMSVVSWEYIAPEPTEVPFPTMPPFPTFPPMPTMAPFPTMPPFPTFPPEIEAGAGEDPGNGTDTGSTGSIEEETSKTGKGDTAKQLGFLLLAAGAFAGIQIYKHRSKKKAQQAAGRKPKR